MLSDKDIQYFTCILKNYEFVIKSHPNRKPYKFKSPDKSTGKSPKTLLFFSFKTFFLSQNGYPVM